MGDRGDRKKIGAGGSGDGEGKWTGRGPVGNGDQSRLNWELQDPGGPGSGPAKKTGVLTWGSGVYSWRGGVRCGWVQG